MSVTGEDKLICRCWGVKRSDILSSVLSGKVSIESFIKKTGASTGCSTCGTDLIREFSQARFRIVLEKTDQPALPGFDDWTM